MIKLLLLESVSDGQSVSKVAVDPGQSTEVEVATRSGDCDIGEAGVSIADGFRDETALGVLLVGVLGRWEVVTDPDGWHSRPLELLTKRRNLAWNVGV
jgi:hypothetical protein